MRGRGLLMKRAFLLLLAVCMLGFSGCRRAAELPAGSGAPSGAGGESTASAPWTARDVQAAFEREGLPAGWTITDCAAAEDRAYGCVGAVLFTDEESNTSNVAFVREDGSYQRCGVAAKTSEKSELTYLGNGAVTFQLETAEGNAYACKVSFSADGSDVRFIVEDELSP